MRNNELEGAALIEAIDPGAVRRIQAALCPANGLTAGSAPRINAVLTLLERLMLRRLKADVLDLPAKRHIDVPVPLDLETCDAVPELMAKGRDAELRAVAAGRSHADARQERLPFLNRARRLAGLAKVDATAEFARNVVEEAGCVILFAHHHDVIDRLRARLAENGLRAVVVTGATDAKERARAAAAFQAGEAEVFLGSTQAAGEAITLTRAHVAIFAELDWVPGVLAQAEDRGHRVGQTASTYLVFRVIGVGFVGEDDIEAMMLKALSDKSETIVATLREQPCCR